jgi:hypothetical protein
LRAAASGADVDLHSAGIEDAGIVDAAVLPFHAPEGSHISQASLQSMIAGAVLDAMAC